MNKRGQAEKAVGRLSDGGQPGASLGSSILDATLASGTQTAGKPCV